ncbi:MAG TPA: hypothetical protein VKU85_03985, partial [bacterium]|nr:hypothetical protein [bacterium]
MAFLHTLRRWLGLDGAGTPAPDAAELRRRVEAHLESDDAAALARLLRDHREEGKVLIRSWEAEIRE